MSSDVWDLFVAIFKTVLVVGGALCIGMTVGRFIHDRRYEQPSWREDHEPKPVPPPMFCRDCGKTMASVRSQSGYNAVTGKPSYSFVLRCPSWKSRSGSMGTMGIGSGAPSSAPSSALMMGMFLEQDPRNCGNRVASSVPSGHSHDGGAPMVDCPACLDEMVANGALTPAAAHKLYLDAGVR